MIDFSYDTVYGLYTGFFKEVHLDDLTNFFKVLAVTFFLLNVYTNMFSKMGTTFTLGQPQLPFDTNKLMQSFIMVLIIAFYDRILDVMDSILINFDSVYSNFSPLDFVPKKEEGSEGDINFEWTSAIVWMATEFLKVVRNPLHIIVLIVESVAWIIDAAIYGVFLLERFFFIGLLKVLGAFAIVLAIFERHRDLFKKWVTLYVAVYLLIIPFFLIIGFASFIFKKLDTILKNQEALEFMMGTSSRTILLVILIWLKLRLFKKSYDIVYKLF